MAQLFESSSRLLQSGNAQDEYKARAVVQKARELTGVLAQADAHESAERERTNEAAAQQKQEREAVGKSSSSDVLPLQFLPLLAPGIGQKTQRAPHDRRFSPTSEAILEAKSGIGQLLGRPKHKDCAMLDYAALPKVERLG